MFFTRAFSLAIAFALAASAEDNLAPQIDEIFKEWSKADSPGASVAVTREGKLVFQKGYGIANLEYNVPITPDTVFHVASVSKQFTAMALVLLEQDGKLSLGDDIRKYLTELPDYSRPVTIQNLLRHTGGIRDQWQTLALAGWRLDDVITQKQILRMLFRQRELNFPPDKQFLYSNGGYTLAAEIVARVSGQPFPQFCQERIFKPLGMTHTHFHDDHKRIVKDRAYSYSKTASGYESSPLNYANAGATSLFTTAPDLTKWLDNFRDPRVGGKAGVNRLQEQGVLSDGKKIDYALGVSIGKHRGLKTVSHGGGDAGYRSYVMWFPDQLAGVAVLSNTGNFNPGGITNKVAAVLLRDKMEPEIEKAKVARQYISLDPATLTQYPGVYRMAAGFTIEIESSNGKLQGGFRGQSKSELKPLASNKFYIDQVGADAEFIPKVGGGMSLKMTQGGGSTEGERIQVEAFNAADLPQYAGSYWSDELQTQYTMVLRGGKLIADHVRHGEIALTPAAKDQFIGGQWFMQEVKFTRDDKGHVVGIVAGGGRVKGIRFAKQP